MSTHNVCFHIEIKRMSILFGLVEKKKKPYLDLPACHLFATIDVTKFKDGRVHFINSGVKELKSILYNQT